MYCGKCANKYLRPIGNKKDKVGDAVQTVSVLGEDAQVIRKGAPTTTRSTTRLSQPLSCASGSYCIPVASWIGRRRRGCPTTLASCVQSSRTTRFLIRQSICRLRWLFGKKRATRRSARINRRAGETDEGFKAFMSLKLLRRLKEALAPPFAALVEKFRESGKPPSEAEA